MAGKLHPQIQAVLDRAKDLGIPKIQDLSTADARALVESMAAARRKTYAPPQVHSVQETTTGPGYGHVPVRIYRASDGQNAPAIVFYHGGGHVFGSLDSHDTAARFLANVTGTTLISVDYRMGPEHVFPAAVEDCYVATRWVADHASKLGIDADKIAVCGDSAGGNLATVVALLARDHGSIPLSAQILVYPVVNYAGGTPSYTTYGTGYGMIEKDTLDWCRKRYLPDPEMMKDWRASPGLANDLSDLPPTLVLTAECDVLHDEGVAYAAQLNAAGTQAEHVEFPGMIHAFFGYLGMVDDSEKAHQTVAAFLDRLWSGNGVKGK